MDKIHLAILWHQHQPYYANDPAGGDPILPWVRLHAIKDYWGMARHVAEVPEARVVINLVPSLLLQLEACASGRHVDRFEQIARRPAADLSVEERRYVLENFFKANHETMVKPFARYRELLVKGMARGGRVLKRFSVQDILDLQVWHCLGWFHPILQEEDPVVSALIAKGNGFTETEKIALYDRGREVVGEIIGLHRRLAETGQIEITTTPFFHPILPLLLDMEDARAGLPGLRLPRNAFRNADDAREQVQRAVRFHERCFGVRPLGMWPSEGSVSPGVVPLVQAEGIRWIASDEEVLLRSLGRPLRGGDGPAPPEVYRPWRLEHEGAAVDAVFRDHQLSDLIGFDYQRADAEAAARDFVGRLHRIADAVPDRPLLVPVILDGENAWEFYPGGGVPFLRAFYRALAADPLVEMVRVGDYVDAHPPKDAVTKLWPGSWINHNFKIWIGHDEDRRGWERLYEAREALVAAEPGLSEEARRAAWDEIYIAEGSDWYWWFGDDHGSMEDAEFDELFRTHVANVYRLAGLQVPLLVEEPIKAGRRPRATYTQPRRFLEVELDGLVTSYFEWMEAGRCDPERVGGTMARGTPRAMGPIHFGCDKERLLVRVDPAGEPDDFLRPGRRLVVEASREARGAGSARVVRMSVPLDAPGRGEMETPGGAWAVDRVVEIALPFEALGIHAGDTVRFRVQLDGSDGPIERAPQRTSIRFTRPGPHFDEENWLV